MIVTELYNGQGLGNQLWCYCVTRSIAIKNNYSFGIQSPQKFKGKNLFKNIDFGQTVEGGSGPEGGPPDSLPIGITNYYRERKEINPIYYCDVSRYDSNLVNVSDNTKIDGVMQCEDYILSIKNDIYSWLTLKTQIQDYSYNNVCVIHIRGGDFFGQKEVALTENYYKTAIKYFKQINKDIEFVCVTDDLSVAKQLLPDVEIVSSTLNSEDSLKAGHHLGGDISIDYAIMNSAKNIIMSNSSFAWWAVWTNQVVNNVVAPKYWARHNISNGFWSNGDSLTRDWLYLGRDGNMYTYKYCLKEKKIFEDNNKNLYITIK